MSETVQAKPPSDWSTDPKDYNLITQIGKGAFADVFKAETAQQLLCAVKVLDLDSLDTNLEEIRQEVQTMRLLSHKNVLTCYTAFVNDRSLWLITPLMKKGSSINCLKAARHVQPDLKMEPHIMYILHETLVGLNYIHENHQIHRDIKAGNILVGVDGNVKIADFGVSGFLIQGGKATQKAKTFVGTPCWMSPEVMEQVHGYDYRADVWSLGITGLELAKGFAPYARYPPMKVLILTIQEDPPSLRSYDVETDYEEEVTEEYSKSFETFVDACLQKRPEKRPTCDELLKSKHFSAFTDPDYLETCRQSMKACICDVIPDVGRSKTAEPRHPGTAPISILTGGDRVAGTTWVFADGSQVLSSQMQSAEVDDVMDEIENFGQETGGEHYNKQKEDAKEEDNDNNNNNKSGDDLETFMDDFEKTTGGEDFRRREESGP